MANKTVGDFMGKSKTTTRKRTTRTAKTRTRKYTRRTTPRNRTNDVPTVQLRLPTNPQAAFQLGFTAGLTARAEN